MPQQNLRPNETVIAHASDDTQLILYDELEPGTDLGEWLDANLTTLDEQPGGLRWHYPEHEGDEATSDTEYERFVHARLAFGLWLRCGPFHQPESGRSVPKEVALDGDDALTAYLYLNNGHPLSRAAVAEMFDVTEQTISDRLSRVRWQP